jgi:hypothetical protein
MKKGNLVSIKPQVRLRALTDKSVPNPVLDSKPADVIEGRIVDATDGGINRLPQFCAAWQPLDHHPVAGGNKVTVLFFAGSSVPSPTRKLAPAPRCRSGTSVVSCTLTVSDALHS